MTNELNPDVTLCVYKCFNNFRASRDLSQFRQSELGKAPRPSISDIIWILSSDTICLLSQLFQIVRRQCCLVRTSRCGARVPLLFMFPLRVRN